MTFLYPSFLWALLAVLVPVIIHLFNFRRYKKVYFSNVKFLKELQLESKSRSRLRELLVLLARCLAIVALVLAFARPYRVDPDTARDLRAVNEVSIYVDNSFSMENVGRQGPLLELAKLKAREIVDVFGESARFHVITNSFGGKEQRFNTRDNALDMIAAIKTTPAPRLLSQVHKRQKSFLENSSVTAPELYFISDAQKTTFDLDALNPDSVSRLNIVPLKANKVNNLYLDSCWFDSPVQQKGFRQRVYASIVNNGTSDIESGSARLYLNEVQVALATFSVRAGRSATVAFSFSQNTGGFNFGRVEIDDYPVTFDDRLYFAFNARLSINVVLINGRGVPAENPFTALFGKDSIFSLKSFNTKAIDYGAFGEAELIILNETAQISSGLQAELQKFAAGGGGIVLVPPDSLSDSYAATLKSLNLPSFSTTDTVVSRVAEIDQASGFFEGVFEKMEARVNMPLVTTHHRLPLTGTVHADKIMVLENGDPFLISTRSGNANVYLFSSSLSMRSSNFSRHALFVPAFFRIALNSIAAKPAYYTLEPGVVVNMKVGQRTAEMPPHITGHGHNTDIIPEIRVINNRMLLFPRNQLLKPGYYTVNHLGNELVPLAFNYSRIESDLDAFTEEELVSAISENGWKGVKVIEQSGAAQGTGVLVSAGEEQLWKLFIILALVFFLAEILLLRFLK